MSMSIPSVALKDGNRIPLLAFGTGTAWFKDDPHSGFDPALVKVAKTAILTGFRHLDCSEMYGTEEEVGVAMKESGVPRENLFITTKVADGVDDIPGAMSESLRKLQTDYVDLYLVHNPFFAQSDADLQRVWKGMESIKASGKARSIGVSNYLRADLEATLKTAVDPPVLNQIEYHPYLQRANGYVDWMKEHGIQLAAFKPLTPVAHAPDGPLLKLLDQIAKRHSTTNTAVLLAWYTQRGVVASTTTRKEERLKEYALAPEVKLSTEEVDEITMVGLTHHCRMAFSERFDDDDRS